ncbi:acetyltransferase [Candidatus Spyradosoma sp. SGI.093]|uniref:acetyltransferase n=1 Tax=Candidatus Spyradosoma sp. SGI.093 TaxID=3420583 RepID=UPI003CFD32D9
MSAETKEIAIYGAGGFGREVACLIRKINEASPDAPPWKIIGFFDDGVPAGTRNPYGEILGGIDALNAFPRPLAVAIAIGNPHALSAVVGKIRNENVSFPNVFSPDLIFLDRERIEFGRGNIVAFGCLLSTNVRIGDFNVFNSCVTVGHDAEIGSFNSFMPGSRISGSVQIGDRNFFGLNSGIFQGIKIGDDVTLGGNSFAVTRLRDGKTYVGNPASVFHF